MHARLSQMRPPPLLKFNKEVSVLILSWKDAPFLHNWFDMFLKYTPKNLTTEVITLENGSNDPEFDVVAEKYGKFGDFHFLKNRIPGYIPAINKIASLAKGKYIMLAAPGAPFLSDVVGTMKSYLDRHPEVGAVSAKFMNGDGTFQNVYKKFTNLPLIFLGGMIEIGRKPGVFLSRYFNLSYTLPKTADPSQPFPIERTHLCSFMLRREAIGNEPIIEPKIPLGPCDVDLCKRICQRGYKILGLPEARVIHHRSAAFNRHEKGKKLQYSILGTLQYFKKHHPIQYPVLKFLFILDQFLAILRLNLTNKKKKDTSNIKNELAHHRHMLSLLFRHELNVLG